MFQEKLRQAAWQLSLLIITACVIGIAVNNLRPDGLALVGNWSEQARFADAVGESLVIGLDEAAALFERNAVLFLDARPQEQYMQGHICGALNLPWQESDRYFMELTERLSDASMIITYCDGEHCDLSHELALFLKEMGFENVRVLVNGWTVWQQAGRPTDMGNRPQEQGERCRTEKNTAGRVSIMKYSEKTAAPLNRCAFLVSLDNARPKKEAGNA